MNTQFKENKTTAITLIALGLCAAALLIQPMIRSQGRLDKEIRISKGKLHKYRGLLRKKNMFPERHTILNTGEGKRDTITAVLIELERLALANEVKINDMRPDTMEGKNPVITIRTEANIRNFISFFYHLERSGLYLSVKRLQLNARPNSTAIEGICALDLAQ